MKDYHIVAVDDSRTILKLIELTLKGQFRKVDLYDRPETALEAIFRDRPDIIILDIMMPEMSGTEMCEEIKKREEFKNTPVLFLSAIPLASAIEQGILNQEADYFMPKPFKPARLLEELDRIVDVLEMQKKTSSNCGDNMPWEV